MEKLLHLQTTDSTNSVAYQLALNGTKHGYGVLADRQLAGKGRLGKDWKSPAKTGIYCSIILRPKLPLYDFPKLTLTAGLSLCSAVEKLSKNTSYGLKWPNDLYYNTKKCGGILVESSIASGTSSFAVVGIGLNVNTTLLQFPIELRQKATSLYLQSGNIFDIRELYWLIHESLLTHMEIHETQGFESILTEWRKRDVLLGKEVEWVTCDKKVVIASGLGPDKNGQLLAKDRTGMVHKILSGDVQLADNPDGKK